MAKEGGYTIVEAGLAVAMSSVMVLLTIGLAAMVGRQRFRDSLSTAQSFIQAQYNEVRSGINSRLDDATSNLLGCGKSGTTSATGTSANCYTIGRVVTFQSDEIKSSYVIAKTNQTTNWPNKDLSAVQNLKNVQLYALVGNGHGGGLNPTIKNIGNGSTVSGAWSIDGRATSINLPAHLVILRSPVDGSLVVVSGAQLQAAAGLSGDVQSVNISASGAKTNMSPDQKLAVAIVNGGIGFSGGVICIPGGDSSAGISNNFNPSQEIIWTSPADSRNQTAVVGACKNWE